MPDAVAVVTPNGRSGSGRSSYRTISFSELDMDATRLARGLVAMGVLPGDRLVLLVPVGIEFVTLVFALLRSGAVGVLIDPGMGRKHLLDCLAAVEPDGFVAISRVQAVRALLRKRFPRARHHVTIGRRWFWGGQTLHTLRQLGTGTDIQLPDTFANDPAAIIFTSGSTGPAKGVLYRHATFTTQAAEIQKYYQIEPGGTDLACFALFGLFNLAMGVTTVFPDIDFSKPATADPVKLIAAARDWSVTQAFASPAVWDRLGRYCERTGSRIESLTRIFSCGAPVSAEILSRTRTFVHPQARMATPYGATEALPVASIEAEEILGETASKTAAGAGICVGRKFDSIDWKIIRITDAPVRKLNSAIVLPAGEIGELIVRGSQVSQAYATRIEANDLAKIHDGDSVWHRMGDAGYFDGKGRFWYCGRLAHRVETPDGAYYPVCYEAIMNQHSAVRRSALVRSGTVSGCGLLFIVEPVDRCVFKSKEKYIQLCDDLYVRTRNHPATKDLQNLQFAILESLPVDIRHNSKINREYLAEQANQWKVLDRRIHLKQQAGQWMIEPGDWPVPASLPCKILYF
ncbi:MAG: AMP-binding protein, partial [Pirellulales bacterium]|nr:AMP-binding protein [Pirellulales bacterium]